MATAVIGVGTGSSLGEKAGRSVRVAARKVGQMRSGFMAQSPLRRK